MNRNQEDKLRQLDFDAAFPRTPESIGDAIRLAGLDIERRELAGKRRVRRVCAAAAILALGVGIAATAVRLGGAPDSVVPPKVTVERETVEGEVYASLEDPYYHERPDCPEARPDAVALPIETAIEFEKQPCPACAVKGE